MCFDRVVLFSQIKNFNLRTISIRKWFQRNACLPFRFCCCYFFVSMSWADEARFFCFISFSGYQCARFIFRQFVTICTNLISMWTVELFDLKQFLPNFNHTFNHSSHIARIFFWVYETSSGLRLYFVEFCQIICIVTTVTYHGMNYHVHCMCKNMCCWFFKKCSFWNCLGSFSIKLLCFTTVNKP